MYILCVYIYILLQGYCRGSLKLILFNGQVLKKRVPVLKDTVHENIHTLKSNVVEIAQELNSCLNCASKKKDTCSKRLYSTHIASIKLHCLATGQGLRVSSLPSFFLIRPVQGIQACHLVEW